MIMEGTLNAGHFTLEDSYEVGVTGVPHLSVQR